MITKHAAVIDGAYREWTEDHGPRRARPDVEGEMVVPHRHGRLRPLVMGTPVEPVPPVLPSRRSYCCGVLQTHGNPCARCLSVVWPARGAA